MLSPVSNTTDLPVQAGLLTPPAPNPGKALGLLNKKDTVSFGQGNPLTAGDTQNVVLNQAFEKLRAVISEAREALGIPEDATLDTSEEATAGRIVDFALGFFQQYAENNNLKDDEEGRAQFAEFIGGAIMQGIAEARDILSALKALDGNPFDIDQTSDIIQSRLDDFVANGLSA